MQDLFLSFGKEIAVGLLTAFGALFVFLLKNFFAERKRRMKKAEAEIRMVREKADQQIDELKRLMCSIKDDVRISHDVLKDKINENEKHHIRDFGEMRGQIGVMTHSLNAYSENVSKLSGRVDDQLNITASHIGAISHMSKQMDALFKIVDAQKRASDCQDSNGSAD